MEKKRSLKYLLVSACLALMFASIGGIVSGAAEAQPIAADFEIKGASLDLNDKIAIAFAVDATTAGYNPEDGTVAYNVETYNYNPDGTSDEGKVLAYVVKTLSDGNTYVIYVTDGFAADKYGDTVYARLVDKEDGRYGKSIKTGVIELVSTLKANIKSSDPRKTVKTNLYNTILKYGEDAYKVVHGEASPYRYVTIQDGYYLDNAGEAHTAGVFNKGDKITLYENGGLNLASVSVVRRGWLDGNNFLTGANVVTVNDAPSFAPAYAIYGSFDADPYYNTGASTNTIAMNVGMHWSDLKYATLKGDMTAGADGLAPTFYDGKTLTLVAASDKATEYKIVEINAEGDMSITWDYNKSWYVTNGGTRQCYGDFMYFNNAAVLGSNPTMTFKYTLNSDDSNGNGKYNEINEIVDAVYEFNEDLGEEVLVTPATTAPGDVFIASGNRSTARFYLVGLNGTPEGVNEKAAGNTSSFSLDADAMKSSTPIWFDIFAHEDVANNQFDGWYFRTTAGSGQDNNQQHHTGHIFNFDQEYTITAEFVLDATGKVTAVKLYVDGELVATRTDVCTANKQDKKIYLAGENAATDFGFGHLEMGRFQGSYTISSPVYAANDYYTAAEIQAMSGYNGTNKSGIYVTGNNTYDWNQLAYLPGVNQYGNYYTSAKDNTSSWLYDADADAIFYKNYTSAVGSISVYADNPIKNATYAAGLAAVYEVDVTLGVTDANGNGKLNEKADYGINNNTSVIHGTFIFGAGASADMGAANARLVGIQLRRGTNEEMFMRLGSNISYDSNYKDAASNRNGGTVRIKLVYVPGADGKTAQADLYINGVLIRSMTNVADAATGFTWNQSSNKNLNKICDGGINYLGFRYDTSSNRVGVVSFRNVKCYMVTDYGISN